MADQYVSIGAAWFTLSLINAGLGQSKGRSGLNWWAVSLLLGPIATLLIVVWPPVIAGVEQRPEGTMSTRQSVVIIAVAALVFGGLALLSASR